MAVRSEKDLPEQYRATWLKALSAMELKNYGYTVQLLQTVLKDCPDFLSGRQVARKAAIAKSGTKKSLLGGLSSASFSTMKVQSLLKKDPLAAMDAVEKILENEPFNPQANMLLREAAMAANMPETAAFALETIIEGNPKETKILHELARHYLEQDAPEKAVEIYGRITAITPNDLVAVKGGKDAAARASMKRGGWDREETTYRELIRDKELAVSLEQQGRVVRSEEMIEQQLAEWGVKYNQNPQNVDVARKIAELYEQKEDLANAVQWFEYAASLTNNSDAALVRRATDLRMKQFDVAIEQREEYIAANPGTAEAEQYAAELDGIRKQRSETLLDEAKRRVERNPTDLQFRFELGDIYMQLERFQDAIPELQKARTNPNVRLKAMNLLGHCYTGKGMFDLAAKILTEAAGEIASMDSTKKEIVYNLGLVYERMGQKDKSIEAMKQIYEVDYGYRDVAARVEGSYDS